MSPPLKLHDLFPAPTIPSVRTGATLIPIVDATYGPTRTQSTTFAALTKYALQELGVFPSVRARPRRIGPDERDNKSVRHAMPMVGLI